VDSGQCPCARCGQLIPIGAPWHLDHSDDGRGWLGPSHAYCNLKAGGKLGNARLREKKALERLQWLGRPSRASREW
jgi:hypothetical protein